MKAIMLAVSALVFSAPAFSADSAAEQSKPVQLAQDIAHYWVYCIDGKTSVEQWDLDQMKARRGSNVCQLHEDTSVSGSQGLDGEELPVGRLLLLID